MKKYLFVLLCCVATVSAAHALSEEPVVAPKVMPRFQGGDEHNFYRWASEQILIPEIPQAQFGVVKFWVEKDGSIVRVKFPHRKHTAFEKEMERVLLSSPAWESGQEWGKPAKTQLSADFRLFRSKKTGIYRVTIGSSANFMGEGVASFRNWVGSQLVYPRDLAHTGIEGSVSVEFTIRTDGTISNIEIVESDHWLFSIEALRVLSSSPKWAPAMLNGQPANQLFTLSLYFELEPVVKKPYSHSR